MINAKELKAVLQAAIYLTKRESVIKAHDYDLNLVSFDFGKYLRITATDEYCFFRCEFLRNNPGNLGMVGLNVDQCRQILSKLPKEGDILFTSNYNSLTICHGMTADQFTGPADFAHPDFDHILNHCENPPQGFKADFNFKYFYNVLRYLSPLVDDRLELFIKGTDHPLFVSGKSDSIRFDFVVMPLMS